MLLDQIKQDQLALRKGDRSDPIIQMKINALTTLIGEASPSGTQVATDETVQAVVRKFVKNLDEALAVVHDRMEADTNTGVIISYDVEFKYSLMQLERMMYASYLPAVFDVADINKILDTMPVINIGAAMGACKKAAIAIGKMFDGALVQKAIKERV